MMMNIASSTTQAIAKGVEDAVAPASQASQTQGVQDKPSFGHVLSKQIDAKKGNIPNQEAPTKASATKTQPGKTKLGDGQTLDAANTSDANSANLISNPSFSPSDLTLPTVMRGEPVNANSTIAENDPTTQALLASLGQNIKLEATGVAVSNAPLTGAPSNILGAEGGINQANNTQASNTQAIASLESGPLQAATGASSFAQSVKGFMELGSEKVATSSIQDQANVDLAVIPSPFTLADVQAKTMTVTNTPIQPSSLTPDSVVQTPFGSGGWTKEIGQKIVWMVGGADQSATLTLNPPDLGPLKVVIHVNNDMVNTTFLSNNADVRQALQDGLDNLRQSMAQSGIALGQANVNSEKGQGQNSFGQNFASGGAFGVGINANVSIDFSRDEGGSILLQRRIQSLDGSVNTFA